MLIKYNVFKTDLEDINQAIPELLRQISHMAQTVRVQFFAEVNDNARYSQEMVTIKGIVSQWFAQSAEPLVGYIAQAPVDCRWAMEVQYIDKAQGANLEFKEFKGTRYAMLLSPSDEKMMLSEVISPESLDVCIATQSQEVLAKAGAILESEEMRVKNIDRQWNYIESITRCEDGLQNYQVFNDARSQFYADTHWDAGYPAATGIGTTAGGVMVEFDAANLSNTRTVALDNKLQVAAHAYSKEVLHGEATQKSTPKFERARAIVYQSVFGDSHAQIYISGTAAIRGEESLTGQDISAQTAATLGNIAYLISAENLEKHGIRPQIMPALRYMRVYLKYAEDFEQAQKIISNLYPMVPAVYVVSDVCRDELLIEIEGLAE